MSIGYACMTIGVPDTGITRCILKNAEDDKLRSVISTNLNALENMLIYNRDMGIKLFRISSDIIPFASHPINQIPWWAEYGNELMAIGKLCKTSGIRVSMHPGQYSVLNSPDEKVVGNAIKDLIYHDRLLTAMGMDRSSKLVLHIGGIYGDKSSAMKTFIRNYRLLPGELRDRLILENDDKNYNIREVLAIADQIGAPVVFDNLHHAVNPPDEDCPEEYWIRESGKTWQKEDGRQKIHYSQQKAGGLAGSHSDTIALQEFLTFYDRLSEKEIDIMLEVKDKNLSAVKCMNRVQEVTAKDLETEWARYKYFTLSRSARLYQEIRQLLKDKEAKCSKEFYEILEKACSLPEDPGAQVNAAQHVWGYISEDCTKAEKNRYDKLMEAYQSGKGEIRAVKNHLFKCAQIRSIKYLVQSLYFYI